VAQLTSAPYLTITLTHDAAMQLFYKQQAEARRQMGRS
jgi:hypothetical protein